MREEVYQGQSIREKFVGACRSLQARFPYLSYQEDKFLRLASWWLASQFPDTDLIYPSGTSHNGDLDIYWVNDLGTHFSITLDAGTWRGTCTWKEHAGKPLSFTNPQDIKFLFEQLNNIPNS